MAQQKINYGAAPNDGTGDLYRVAMIKIDNNFTDLYTNKVDKTVTIALSGGATGTATALSGAAVVIPVTGLNMGNATAGTLAVARGGTGVTTSTGTGANVQAVSPALTGTPTVPTAADTANSTQIASTAFVRAAMVKNGMLDIFGSAVDRYVSSAGTAVAPYDDANTFPPGTRVLAARSFVANLPGTEALIYVETTANYTATAGRLQIGYGCQNGGCWMRWATSSNIYGSWQKFLMESGGNMGGQLGVLNQLATDNSVRAANTAFVHGAMDFYGVSVGSMEAQSEPRLTGAGQPATNDFNLMVGATGGGIYTLAGSYLNGPNGEASAAYTAVLQIIRRKFNAGPAVIQCFYGTEQNGGIVTVFMRSGAFVSNAWSWGVWRKLAFETSNVASATKLRDARTITVGNTSKTFDGTGNISFSGAEIGVQGPNRLYNTDFLQESPNKGRPSFFSTGGSAAGRVTSIVAYSTDPARKAIRNEAPAGTNGQTLDITSTTTEAELPVVPGTDYVLSVKARTNPGADFTMYAQLRNAAGTTVRTLSQNFPGSGDGTFKRYELPVPASQVTSDIVSVNLYYGRSTKTAASAAAMYLEIAEPQWQEGLVATPYSPGVGQAAYGLVRGLTAGQDFNALILDGTYAVWSDLSGMTNNPPTSRWGLVTVSRQYSRIFQTYLEDGGLFATYSRRSSDGGATWSAWVSDVSDLSTSYGASQVAVVTSRGTNATVAEASTTQAGVMSAASKVKLDGIENNATKDWTGTPISTNGADLNSYTTQGAYFCSANAVSQTLLNNPTTKAFSLNVYATAGCVQYLTEYASASNAANRMWVRGMYSNTWSAWQEVVTSARPQLTTTTDTAGTNNTNIASTAFVQQATSGSVSINTTGGTVLLTEAQASNIYLNVRGALTSNVMIEVPDVKRLWIVGNNTTGSFTVSIKQTGAPTGNVVVAQGYREIVFSEGTGVYKADYNIRSTAIGGTGSSTSTGTGSVVLSASPALTGNPTATTQAATDNSTRLATTAFVKRAVENPLGAVDQRTGTDNTYQRLWSVGWTGKGASWLWELTDAGNFNLVQYNKDTGNAVAQVASFKPGGEVYFPGYINSRLDSWYTNVPAVTQKGNIGNAFANWTLEAVPALQIDCSDKLSAYMVWRGTRWGGQHLAAMHVHETNAQNPTVTLSLAGGNYQHDWRKDTYSISGTVWANGVQLTSDQRLKNIRGKVTDALAVNRKLAKVMFSYKLSGGYTAGYVAQSVKKHAPWAVSERDARPDEKPFSGDKVLIVDYQALSVNTAAAVAELEAIVAQQRKELDELKSLLREHLKA